MAPTGVTVAGLSDLRRELRRAGVGIEDLKAANRSVSELVATGAVGRARNLGGVARHVADAGSIKTSSAAAAAKVILGGTAAKHGPALGAEFGARNYPQFEEWRGAGREAGYFLWPTIRAEERRIVDMYGDAIDDLMSKAFPT